MYIEEFYSSFFFFRKDNIMKKFWRSGMIDKKVVVEREREEYINRLHRTILELRRDDVGDLINDTTDYDEIRCGDNVINEEK